MILRKTRRTFALVLALVMVFAIMPSTAFAAQYPQERQIVSQEAQKVAIEGSYAEIAPHALLFAVTNNWTTIARPNGGIHGRQISVRLTHINAARVDYRILGSHGQVIWGVDNAWNIHTLGFILLTSNTFTVQIRVIGPQQNPSAIATVQLI